MRRGSERFRYASICRLYLSPSATRKFSLITAMNICSTIKLAKMNQPTRKMPAMTAWW